MERENFTFEISLSVLNHLGRNLYRSFATVLGEAISNAWDAEATNVWIYIDRENRTLVVKDDGNGMTSSDFQTKFLRIGYTKRREGQSSSTSGRPFIGRKGIGKLALLSCAEKISIITKTTSTGYVGGVIDNHELNEAITEDLTPQEYPLSELDMSIFSNYQDGHDKGTIIYFENLHDGIRNTLETLKKTIALYFRFSLIDDSFNIYVNGALVTIDSLEALTTSTEFLWKINQIEDPYIQKVEEGFTQNENETRQLTVDPRVKGFVGSVKKPSDLKIIGTGEEVSVDLFVNGRLRERDILRHNPTARVVESYLYGQIHFNELDDDEDRFTSSREGVVANDPKYEELLKIVNDEIIRPILSDWDKWRRKHHKDGDSDNPDLTKKDRKSEELYNAVAEEYKSEDGDASEHAKRVDGWVNSLGEDAAYNFGSYADSFMSENLIRKYINEQNIQLSPEAQRDINDFKNRESQNKAAGNISIELRQNADDLSYLDMMGLAKLVDNTQDQNNLPQDGKQYRPIRDALMHTALLSDDAKTKLTTVFANIKGRVKSLLSSDSSE